MELPAQTFSSLASVIALASLALTCIVGVLLSYHLIRYALSPAVTSFAILTYLLVSAALLSGMFASLIALSV